MSNQPAFYRTIWRWHFYAGLFCIPFVLILATTGSIYLFKPQIEDFRESAYNQLIAHENRKTANEHIGAALAALPKTLFMSYRMPKTATDAIRISVVSDAKSYYVYVNPFDLSVLQVIAQDSVFIEQVKNIHGELLAGQLGTILVELAASWAIVLLATGLYLWWPRNLAGIGGTLVPRIHLRGRKLWKDLHAVMGIWVAIFAIFLLVSGLPWTTVWGTAFKESRNLFDEALSQDWSTSRTADMQSWQVQAVADVDLTAQVFESASLLSMAWPAELSISHVEKNLWKLASSNQNRRLRQTGVIEGASGEVIYMKKFSDKKALDQVIGIGISAHEGQLFGLANQLLGVFTALGLIFLSISGFILWRKRKPGRSLGAPEKLGQIRWQKRYLLPLILLPTLLCSVIVILIVQFVAKQTAPLLKRYSGAGLN